MFGIFKFSTIIWLVTGFGFWIVNHKSPMDLNWIENPKKWIEQHPFDANSGYY